MKIILFGSSYLTQLVEEELLGLHEVLGHVPSIKPTFPGKMNTQIIDEGTECDLRLSVQYDKKMFAYDNAYNLHTGLLPLYGGCEILYNTLKNKEIEQGLTFHKISDKFDEGEIISKITYPVFPNDRAVHLYKRICAIIAPFAVASINLLDITPGGIYSKKPALYKRGDIRDIELYERDFKEIKSYVES